MIDGLTSRAFSALTIPPLEPRHESLREEIIQLSRQKYGTPRENIEAKIQKWSMKEEQEPRPRPRPRQDNRRPQNFHNVKNYQPRTKKQEFKPAQERTIGLEEAHKKYPPKKLTPPKKIQKPSYLNRKKPEIDREGLRALLDDVEKSKKGE